MNTEEVRKVFDILIYNVKGFSYDRATFDAWFEELNQYDSNDVFARLKELLAEKTFQTTTPTVYYLVKGLIKANNKVDFTKLTYLCSFCKKAFNDRQEYERHTDRCRSVKYIISQYRRFNLGEIDNAKKKELYNMNEEEFIGRYDKLLKFVQKNTNDELEKRRIEFIFNPPSLEQARKFLNS